MKRVVLCTLLLSLSVCFGADVNADDGDDIATYSIELKDHHFSPAEIHVAAGKPFIVTVTNNDSAPEEFEMLLPPLERVIRPGQQGKMRIKPLAAGRFPFFGENDPDSERGAFISE